MFFDWVEMYQDFDHEIPLRGKRAYQNIDTETGEAGKMVQPSWQHPGSFSTSITIQISGNRITMKGNPSRYGRADNLFGFKALDQCVSVYNSILRSLELPVFTKCTKVDFLTDKVGGSAKMRTVSDGAVFKEIHITTNKGVGCGNQGDYLRGISSLSYRNAVPRLHTNGKTVDWLSKKGNANLIYPSVYDKAHELELHTVDKIKAKYGQDSKEYHYLMQVLDFCKMHGVVRFEQKIKGRMLTRLNARFWGLFDEKNAFEALQRDFINIDEKLQVTAMTIEGISGRLLRLGIVDTTRAANTTSLYALQWMHGQTFDLAKSQVKTHRARLRRVGIDIGKPCNISQVSPVYIRKAKEVVVSDVEAPAWYQMPVSQPQLSLVA
ncbi:MAG: hypothetical protein K6L74_07495 [Neptuniibacter sp.]